ncbi:MAG: metallophosphoesterase [Treponemataceae bacterium]|nr:metallophosphoesterase [Treponemataceae bacterium]
MIVLSIGWYQAHHVWRTNYELTTTKDIPDFRILMFADSHLGSTFHADEFADHIERIQQEKPDIVVIVGDYVDDSSSREDMIRSTELLGQLQTKYGVYYVFGNHDRGYYSEGRRGFNAQDLMNELEKNNITILQDKTLLLADSLYLIGRDDFSSRDRKQMSELVSPLDKDKYMIVLDHQPADYINQEKENVDLVLSGHTHGGQLFPFNQVGKWIGVNDLVYGHEKRSLTDFIVTSGISDWAVKFKTGTKSEFLVIDIKKSIP